MTVCPPGSTLGILGGGQLGRMLAEAASRLGLKVHTYCPDADCPAAQVSNSVTVGAYDNLAKIGEFAKTCDVVTYEFENVPAATAAAANKVTPLRPGALALEVAQDRMTEKTFLKDTAKVAVGNFQSVDTVFDLHRGVKFLGLPAVLKTRRFGYDGKGQAIIRSAADVDNAHRSMNGAPAILEAFIDFTREVSIVAARSASGEFRAYPLIENIHQNHILHQSIAPAPVPNPKAEAMAKDIMDALDYVGVMATEFFELEDGSLLVNEIAPRVHNSGHWTQDAGCVDQFEQHVRAVCGWPLGETTPLHNVVMTNLIGDAVNAWADYAGEPGTALHLYGKAEARPGRKMGHVNRIKP